MGGGDERRWRPGRSGTGPSVGSFARAPGLIRAISGAIRASLTETGVRQVVNEPRSDGRPVSPPARGP